MHDLTALYFKRHIICMALEQEAVKQVVCSPTFTDMEKAEVLLIGYAGHQWNLYTHPKEMHNAIVYIAKHKLWTLSTRYKTFDDLFQYLMTTLYKLPQIGHLAVYDVAKRLWHCWGHPLFKSPFVYCYQGAHDGARAYNNWRRTKHIENIAHFTDFSGLDSIFIEDILCIFKEAIAGIRKTGSANAPLCLYCCLSRFTKKTLLFDITDNSKRVKIPKDITRVYPPSCFSHIPIAQKNWDDLLSGRKINTFI